MYVQRFHNGDEPIEVTYAIGDVVTRLTKSWGPSRRPECGTITSFRNGLPVVQWRTGKPRQLSVQQATKLSKV